MIYLPVCGVNGVTYPNQCELDCRWVWMSMRNSHWLKKYRKLLTVEKRPPKKTKQKQKQKNKQTNKQSQQNNNNPNPTKQQQQQARSLAFYKI